MLRLFFFLMTYLADYRVVSELIPKSSTIGLVNATLVCFVSGCAALRARWRSDNGRRASS
jgi:hypothetical protein